MSEEAIHQIQKQAIDSNLSIDAQVLDITTTDINVAPYDVVILSFVLHHIESDKAKELLTKWKQESKSGVIHVIATFTNQGDFYAQEENRKFFYPEIEELKRMYDDWEIITYGEAEKSARTTNQDGTHMHNICAFLVAKKK